MSIKSILMSPLFGPKAMEPARIKARIAVMFAMFAVSMTALGVVYVKAGSSDRRENQSYDYKEAWGFDALRGTDTGSACGIESSIRPARAGDVTYDEATGWACVYNGFDWIRLDPGVEGQFLSSGQSVEPNWESIEYNDIDDAWMSLYEDVLGPWTQPNRQLTVMDVDHYIALGEDEGGKYVVAVGYVIDDE